MKSKYWKIGITAALTLMAGMVLADEVEVERRTVDAEGAELIEVECDFGAGQLFIKAVDMEPAAELEVEYSPRYVGFDVDYRMKGRTGRLHLESDLRRNRIHDDIENEWQLQLSTRYPMEIKMDIGACEAEMDLGGLRLRNLDLNVGATSSFIEFSRPNPERLEEFNIQVGASSLEIVGLGDANFERMSFEGGAASCKLDFRGDFSGKSYVSIEVGVGSLDVIVPKGVAIRIETDDDSWFSSVDFHGLRLDEVDDGIYESRDMDDADDQITFVVEVGLGSVDFYAR